MAEFQTVMSEFRRLCKRGKCDSCPIREKVNEDMGIYCSVWVKNHSEEAEPIIMKWAAEHPIMTNRMRFSEVFGFDLDMLYSVSEATIKWLDAEYKGGKDEQ